jgi:hypothetical protein
MAQIDLAHIDEETALIVGSAARGIEEAAFNRAADLAKSYAEHWEAEAAKEPGDDLAAMKGGHWRIIEKEIRDLSGTVNAGTEPDELLHNLKFMHHGVSP